jgi:hypothetical protein
LQEHPQAQPKNHTVKPKDDVKGAPEEEGHDKAPKHEDDGGGGGEGEGAKKKPKGKGFFKGLSEKAKAFVTRSSESVQKFVSDTEHRAQVLEAAGKSILASPKTYAKRLVATTKEEIHEFKEAGGALKSLVQGKKLDHHQKKALKTVAIHMSIAVTAAALTSTGLLAGAAVFGKGMAQKIALKAAAHALENVHLVQEITHIGHGAHHLLHLVASEEDGEKRKVEKVDHEEAFAILIMQSVIRAMKDLDDKDMAEVLEEASGEQEKQAWKVAAALPEGQRLLSLIDQGVQSFSLVEVWIRRFPSVLTAARAESSDLDGRVRQERFIRYFTEGEESLATLEGLEQAFDDLSLDVPGLANLAQQARQAVRVPQKTTVAYAISDIDFVPNPQTGRDDITYSIETLREWSDALSGWATKGRSALRTLGTKAARLVRT